jgi:DtxR family Mn-dependent transcriptional regulator
MGPLAQLTVGSAFTVARIPEELEFAPGLLDFLQDAQILPGRTGRITAASPDGTITVEIDGAAVGVGVGSFASARILVTA